MNNPQIAIFSTIYDGNRGANSAFVHKAIYEAYFKNELLNINKNIAEVALNNGFSNETQYISTFKKIYNIPPGQYRKSHNNDK